MEGKSKETSRELRGGVLSCSKSKGFEGEDSASSTYKHCWWETLVAVAGTMTTVWYGILVFVYPQKLKGR
jgi:hypothetical protein